MATTAAHYYTYYAQRFALLETYAYSNVSKFSLQFYYDFICIHLRCWRRTRVVMLANFHYNSVMTLSVYISAKRTIIG